MELKNGETYNGHLVSCDTWMNIHLREVICTSRVRVYEHVHSCVCVRVCVTVCMYLCTNATCVCECACIFVRMVTSFGGCQSVSFEGV